MTLDAARRGLLGLLCLVAALPAMAVTLQGVRMHEAPDSTRLVFDTNGEVRFKVFTLNNPQRVVVDLLNVTDQGNFDPSMVAVARERIKALRASRRGNGYRVVIDVHKQLKPNAFTLRPIDPYGHRLVVDLFDPDQQRRVVAQPKSKPDRNVIVAIDAGHGGDDPGAIGPRKIFEKQVVLQIARKVKKRIDAMRGFEGLLIRTGDYYLPHRRRTELARQARADVFLSIHADSFKQASVNGASVYTLSDRGATSETAAYLAERENRSDLLGGVGDVSLSDRDPVVAQVLLDLSMDANRSASIAAGEAILANMGKVTKLHKRGVEQAAFIVLKSPDMPSLLIETGFISNPKEAVRLSQAEHQNNLARAIANGVEQFLRANPPPGTLLARLGGELRYTIVRGDTLSTIAQRYGVTSKTLKSRNGLTNDRIRVGQILLIPTGG